MLLGISNFLFRLLFPKQWDHMGHLVDDVILLEGEEPSGGKTSTGSDRSTLFHL